MACISCLKPVVRKYTLSVGEVVALGQLKATCEVPVIYIQPKKVPPPPPGPKKIIVNCDVSPKRFEPHEIIDLYCEASVDVPMPKMGELTFAAYLWNPVKKTWVFLARSYTNVRKGEKAWVWKTKASIPDLQLEPGKEYRTKILYEVYLRW